MSSLIKKIKNTVFPETWCCAYRFNEDCDTCIIDNTADKFTVIKDSKRYWTADPFLFEKDGEYFLFVEAFDRLKRKGLLAYRKLGKNNVGELNIIYESDSHLSYPFIFSDNDNIYIIPESNKSNELYRLKCELFPDIWKKEKVLLNDRLADTTLFEKSNVNYYLTERVDDSNVFDRLDLFYEKDGVLNECINNPVKLDAETARCAGKLFCYNGILIRPSQDCSKSYGEKLSFNKVLTISESGYAEESIKTVSYSDINVDNNGKYVGIHTYNRLDSFEVIDLKIKHKFNIMNFIGVIGKVFRKAF